MISTMITALGDAQTTSDVKHLLDEVTQEISMSCYTYWAVNVPGRAVRDPWAITTSLYEWRSEYVEKGYALIDPVVVNAAIHLAPFPWGTKDYLKGLTKSESQVFIDAKKHGIKYGILVPIHAPGSEFAAISMIAAPMETEEEFITEYPHRSIILGALAPHIHTALRRILNVQKRTTSTHLLSAREVECLSWVAHGKTFQDIGQILEISRNTVITHVNRAKTKLDVRTSQQAVSLLITNGIIQAEQVGTNI